jgi:hypothetical protein
LHTLISTITRYQLERLLNGGDWPFAFIAKGMVYLEDQGKTMMTIIICS